MHIHFLCLKNGWEHNVLIRYVTGNVSTNWLSHLVRGTVASQRTCNAHWLVHRQQGVLLVLYDFELDPDIAYRIALRQNRRFFIFPALSGFETATPFQLTSQSYRHLSESNGVLPAPIESSVR